MGFWGESGPENGVVLGFWEESGPQNGIVLGIWGETLDQNGVVYGYACQTEASSTRRPLFSLFETETSKTETNLLNSRSSPSLHGFLLQTSPRTLKLPQRDTFPCTRRHKSTRKSETIFERER